ncbi:MAG TPA: AMP-binding protein [Terriglobales bacterium]|nr:AMP-binding protein [Terriglobales bacterium]
MLKTLADYVPLFRAAGHATAFISTRGFRTQKWTYSQVAALACQFARELEARNVGKGDRVLIWGENSGEWAAVFFGCMLRGAVAVPMDKIASPEFARRVANDVQARLVVCSAELAGHIELIPVLELEKMAEALTQHSSVPYPPAALTRDDRAQIIFTSGTTAEPRGVVLTHGNILASIDPIQREIPKYRKYERIFHPIRFLHMLPLSHVFGQFMAFFIPPLIGGVVRFQENFKPGDVLETIRRERISVLVAVPRVIEALKDKLQSELGPDIQKNWKIAENEKFLKRWWRFRKVHSRLGWKFWAIISGGAALDQDTEEFWRRLGYGVIQGYGLTETSSLISLNHPFKIGRRSIGKVLPGREMKLDPETGEILVRGENVAHQYWQGNELKPVTGDEGWFRTGDLGALDEEGNLYFKGRSKNVIVTPAGLKVYPEDLEQALRRQPEVRDCVVFGVARGGNAEACAVLLLRNGASAEHAVAQANQSLADFQKIRCFLTWPDEDFPRTPTQKPKMDLIRRRAEAELGGTPSAGASSASVASSGTLQDLVESISKHKVSLRPGAHLENDLNLSSLDRVELLAAIENRYQVDLSDREVSKINTVADLENLLKRSGAEPKREKTEYPYPRWAQRWPVSWLRLAAWYGVTWPYMMIMGRPKIIGRKKLRGLAAPALIVSNHIAQIDIGYLMAALPARFRNRLAVAMQGEMLRAMRYPSKQLPLLERWRQQMDYFLIAIFFNVFSLPQQAKYRESFRFAGELADNRFSVVIFPEGRRTETGEMSPFKSGIGLLATHLNLPIIPMRIDGLFPFKMAKKHYVPPGAIQVKVGEPVRFSADDDAEEIAKKLQEIVAGL